MKRTLRIDFIRFCLVGGTGFMLNFAILTFLYKILGLQIFIAQLVASEISLFSNFLLHHHWTYKHNKVSKKFSILLWQFHATSWMAILSSAFLVSWGVKSLNLSYLMALIISSTVALLWNFGWTKLVIWRHENKSQPETQL